jgi:23S rRNA (cytosine1962-C5)-methyltransferase
VNDAKLDYSLIDFGHGRKLERFGNYVLDRPEIMAAETPSLRRELWNSSREAYFTETGVNKGNWTYQTDLPDPWEISLSNGHERLWTMSLKPSPFKHIGIFPEQAAHWKRIISWLNPSDRFLNLFAYTGASSLSAAVAGAEVYHVESSRSILNRAAENAKLSGLSSIHWVREDAFEFCRRELKRGHSYQGIIMDPPVFGRSKNGKRWRLEEMLPELLQLGAGLLSAKGFLILNTYSPRISLNVMKELLQKTGLKIEDTGWLSLSSEQKKVLKMSMYAVAIKRK